MNTRTTSTLVTFRKPFDLRGWDDTLPPGTYRVEVDEAEISNVSFLAYRRVATVIHIPAVSSISASHSVVRIDPEDLDRAVAEDGL